MEEKQTRVAIIGIIVEDWDSVARVNDVLHEAADCVIARQGIPYRNRNLNVMSIIVDADMDRINRITGKLGTVRGITAKTLLAK